MNHLKRKRVVPYRWSGGLEISTVHILTIIGSQGLQGKWGCRRINNCYISIETLNVKMKH